MYAFIELFPEWLAHLDAELADRDSHRNTLPYQLHQWWDMWDHHISVAESATIVRKVPPEEVEGGWSSHTASTTNGIRHAHRGLHTAADDSGEDYFAHYRAPGPETGTPLHALNSRYYDNLRYYVNRGGARDEHDAETHDALLAARGNPDHLVTIYRSTPPEHAGHFNTGDWVSTSRAYAAQHGSEDNGRNWPVTSGQARAGDLYNDGNSLQEYGYHGPAMRGESSHITAS